MNESLKEENKELRKLLTSTEFRFQLFKDIVRGLRDQKIHNLEVLEMAVGVISAVLGVDYENTFIELVEEDIAFQGVVVSLLEERKETLEKVIFLLKGSHDTIGNY